MSEREIVASVERLNIVARRDDGDLPLVENVSFEVRAGSVLGVVGETGAGKTITCRALAGLLPPELGVSGRMTFADGGAMGAEEVAHRDVAGPPRCGVVFQNPALTLDPLMRVGQQLTEGVTFHRQLTTEQARERALELLRRMGLHDAAAVMRLYPHQLSGGMSQRVAIARALMPSPRLLVVDEPTSALDAHVRVEVLTLLATTAREHGSAIVLISHDLALISQFASELVVMYGGRIVERGRTAEVLEQPAHPYTQALLATGATLDSPSRSRLPVIEGTAPAPGRLPAGCVFVPRCPRATERCEVERPGERRSGDRTAACHFAFSVTADVS